LWANPDPRPAACQRCGHERELDRQGVRRYQQPLADASVTLTATTSGSAARTLTAVTDVTGTATFASLSVAAAAEVRASVGCVESNAIELGPSFP
jgi:hypothetical protein